MAHNRTRLKLAALYLLTVGLFLLAAYELSFPLLLLRLNLWSCLSLLLIALAAFGTGHVLVERLARSGSNPAPPKPADQNRAHGWVFPLAEEVLLSLAVGLGIIAYVVLAFCMLHLLDRRYLLPVFALLVLFGLDRARRLWRREGPWLRLRAPRRARRGPRAVPPLFRLGVLICIFAPLAVAFFLALTPVHQSDAIRYHMAVPALYLNAGGSVQLPHSAFSNFPFTIEMLYTLALLLGAESAAKLIHWLFLVLLVGAVYALGRHLRMKSLGRLSAVLLVNTPFLPIFASWAFIEVALALYVFLIFYALIRLLRCAAGAEEWGAAEWPPDPAKRRRFLLPPSGWITLCAVFSGLALGTKYTSFFPFALAVLTLLALALKDRLRSRRTETTSGEGKANRWRGLPHPQRRLALLIVLPLLITAPWYLKNTFRLGNPLYPFGGSIFPTPHWSSYNAAFYRYHAGLKGELNEFQDMDALEKLWDLATLPYTLTMGRRIEDDVVYFTTCRLRRLWPWDREDGIRGGVYPFLDSGDRALLRPVDFGRWEIGPLWLLLLPLILTVRRIPWEIRLLLLAGGLLFLFWALTYRDNRFLIPAFAVLALPAGHALLACTRTVRAGSAWFRVFFLAVLLWNLLWLLRSVFTSYNPFPVVTGRQSVLGFLEEQRDTAGFIRAMTEANRLRESGENILLVGEHRAYHCQPPYLAADWFNTPVLVQWIREEGDLENLGERFAAEGIRYILIHQGEIDKYWIYYLPHFLDVDRACSWLETYRAKRNPAALQELLAAVEQSPAWRIYSQLLQSAELLEPVYEEPFTEEERTSRPPLPARSKIGVYRVR